MDDVFSWDPWDGDLPGAPNPDRWKPLPKWINTDCGVSTRIELNVVEAGSASRRSNLHVLVDLGVSRAVQRWLLSRQELKLPLPRIYRSVVLNGISVGGSLTVVFNRFEIRGSERETAVAVELLAAQINGRVRSTLRRAA